MFHCRTYLSHDPRSGWVAALHWESRGGIAFGSGWEEKEIFLIPWKPAAGTRLPRATPDPAPAIGKRLPGSSLPEQTLGDSAGPDPGFTLGKTDELGLPPAPAALKHRPGPPGSGAKRVEDAGPEPISPASGLPLPPGEKKKKAGGAAPPSP